MSAAGWVRSEAGFWNHEFMIHERVKRTGDGLAAGETRNSPAPRIFGLGSARDSRILLAIMRVWSGQLH